MAVCKACEEPLVLRVEDDGDDDEMETGGASNSNESDSVPDDLELGCGCHFHWQCLLDESSSVAMTLKCPSCSTYLPSNVQGPSATNTFLGTPSGTTISAKYSNEGGMQENLDLLPSITEEAYLEGNPEARPARAFHVMCSEGDVSGIVELLRDVSDEGVQADTIFRYQDPLAGMKGGLHLAVEKGQEEVVWLLLWLSSTVPSEAFPEAARGVADALEIGRLTVGEEEDVRTLQDAEGRTAQALAQQLGLQGVWASALNLSTNSL